MIACPKKETDAQAVSNDLKQEEKKIVRVCFVCTGNTCRSPMAAAVANAMAAEAQNASCDVTLEAFSAGLYANDGEPISIHAREALEVAEVAVVPSCDYRRHIAHTLSQEDVERADLLVGMSGSHCMELFMRYPQAAQRITSMPSPISDPFGGDLSVYTKCLDEITEGIRVLLFSSSEPKSEELR